MHHSFRTMVDHLQYSLLESSLEEELSVSGCDWPGCKDEGLHRAPKSRHEINSYHYFCLIHVRQYNKGWNYYIGMSDAEVEEDVRKDIVWDRPSWPLRGYVSPENIIDQMGAFSPDWDTEKGSQSPPTNIAKRGARESWAISIFALSGPVNSESVKSRYKELVKQHHPDKNRGDKAGEEKIKEINEAYEIILEMLCE